MEVRHWLKRPKDGLSVRDQEIDRFRSGHAHEPAPRRTNPEDRAQVAVLTGKEVDEPLPHGQTVAQQRQARYRGDIFRLPKLRRWFIGRLKSFDRQAHRAADQVEILQKINAIPDLRPFLR